MINDLIHEYHQNLRADPSLGADLFARLKAEMRARRLVYGDREIGVSLRPHFISRRQYRKLRRVTRILAGACEKVAAGILANPPLMDYIGLRGLERTLAVTHPGFNDLYITTRFDAFLDGEEIRFVEYNAETPSSITDQNGLNEVLFQLPAMQQLAEKYRLRQFFPVSRLFDALLATYREWGGNEVPQVAIVDWPNLPTSEEFELIRNYFVGCGVPTIICTPDELEYSNGSLYRGNFRIDLLYKRVVVHEFLKRFDETHPLCRAYQNHDVCMINPFRCKLLSKKATFDLLTDEQNTAWFSPLERRTIRQCIPWTRRLIDKKTKYWGEDVELLKFVRRQKNRFILKPNDDYGGRGICFGKKMSDSLWQEAIEDCLRTDYVVQEIINLVPVDFPIFDQESWTIQPMYVDVNPFLFMGEVHGALVRLSDSPVVNVTSGGGETGLFVVEDKL